jgi:hypothetical protein
MSERPTLIEHIFPHMYRNAPALPGVVQFLPLFGGRGEGQSADRLRSRGFKGNAGKGRDGGGGGGGKRGSGSKGSGRGGKRR